MKILLVGGGSGGHIYPCLSLATYLKDKNIDVYLGGRDESRESKIYLKKGFNTIFYTQYKSKIKTLLLNFIYLRKQIKDKKIDKVILFGNYISMPFFIVCLSLKVKIYVHEQNVCYGFSNLIMSLFAKKIFLSLPIKRNIYKRKSILVGNPRVNEEIKDFNPYLNDKKNILIVMGSQGSKTMNDFFMNYLNKSDNKFYYHLVLGDKYYDEYKNKIKKSNNIFIYPFIDNLNSYISNCNLFISRAGATSISEIIKYKTNSILIPSPYVKNNHQYKNALYLLENGACNMIKEKELTYLKLKTKIENNLNNKLIQDVIKTNLDKLDCKNVCFKIYEGMLNE